MATPEVHVCLLSGQLLPNLIPVLMERPERVYLVATPEMVARGSDKRMRRLLRRENVDTRVRGGAPSTGIEEVRRFAEKLAQEIMKNEAGSTIVLNATGGTKLLSMGFVEVFRERLEGYSLRIVYTDTEHRVIETLVPRDRGAVPMAGVLKAESYLAAQGMVLVSAESDEQEWRDSVRARSELTRYLASHCENLGPFLGALNGLVHGKPGNPGALAPNSVDLVHPDQEFGTRPRGAWEKALIRIADAELLGWKGNEKVRFQDAGAARYLGGHWLEEYAWLVAEAVGLDDVRGSAKVRWESESGPAAPTNEFDLLAVHDNRLLLVECKTGRQAAGEQAVATRLESLSRHTGGLFGSGLLLSARELAETMKVRCRSLGIHFLERGAVNGLTEHMGHWKEKGAFPAA